MGHLEIKWASFRAQSNHFSIVCGSEGQANHGRQALQVEKTTCKVLEVPGEWGMENLTVGCTVKQKPKTIQNRKQRDTETRQVITGARVGQRGQEE